MIKLKQNKHYDLVVVGAGVAGLLFAKRAAERSVASKAHLSILVLEAGVDLGRDASTHKAFIDRFHSAPIKTPNSPYLDNQNAPVEPDIPNPERAYYVHQAGSDHFGSNNTRALGGTTLHWMGLTPRLLPEDFHMREKFGVGVDWPIGYEDLRDYYRQAERELGVSGNANDQNKSYPQQDGRSLFIENGQDRDEFPMEAIVASYHDQVLEKRVGKDIQFTFKGHKYHTHFSSIPQARNSTPRSTLSSSHKQTYDVKGGPFDMRAGMGQRCEGNASCIPICPANAKYSALRTFRELEDLAQNNQFLDLEVQPQAVVSNLNVDEKSGRVNSLDFLFYPHSELPARNQHNIEADTFVLAASAIENAKILLISGRPGKGLANNSGQVGCNLMDHPFVLHWGLLKDKKIELGTFRGPGITSDLPVRTGPWRRNHAAFRTDVSNWGWGLAAGAPYKDLYRLTDPQGFARQYKGYNTIHIPAAPLSGEELRAKLRSDVQRQVSLGYLFEQLPRKSNRVTIDPKIKDRLGISRPIIHYKIDPYVIRGMKCAEALTKEVFEKADIQDFTNFEHAIGWPISSDAEGRFKYIGAGHIMGTHRMGSNKQESVVDSYQKSWDHANLFIIGAGSFPTAGTANPTLTIAALSLRSADHYIHNRRS